MSPAKPVERLRYENTRACFTRARMLTRPPAGPVSATSSECDAPSVAHWNAASGVRIRA